MISQAAIDLILKYEVGGGIRYYNRFLSRPTWPEGASGVTIGIGYDLGYEKGFGADWECRLSADAFKRLSRTLGLTGSRAKAALSGVRDIVIPWEDAIEVFTQTTLPLYEEQTLEAFPNADKLPVDAYGALVSLVFNRGPLIDDSDRRREMLAIKEILESCADDEVPEADVLSIAAQVKSMARLWRDDPESDGDLHDRRLDEAALISASV